MPRKPYQRRSVSRRQALVACAMSRSRSTVMGWCRVARTGHPSAIIPSKPEPKHWLSWITSKSARRPARRRRARRLNVYGSGKPAEHINANSWTSIRDRNSHGHGNPERIFRAVEVEARHLVQLVGSIELGVRLAGEHRDLMAERSELAARYRVYTPWPPQYGLPRYTSHAIRSCSGVMVGMSRQAYGPLLRASVTKAVKTGGTVVNRLVGVPNASAAGRFGDEHRVRVDGTQARIRSCRTARARRRLRHASTRAHRRRRFARSIGCPFVALRLSLPNRGATRARPSCSTRGGDPRSDRGARTPKQDAGESTRARWALDGRALLLARRRRRDGSDPRARAVAARLPTPCRREAGAAPRGALSAAGGSGAVRERNPRCIGRTGRADAGGPAGPRPRHLPLDRHCRSRLSPAQVERANHRRRPAGSRGRRRGLGDVPSRDEFGS